MADTQMTILGMSGSGKTCYLLGLYYKMVAGLKGFGLTSDDDTDVELRDRFAKLRDVTLAKEERFPAGTDNTSKYTFNLEYGFKTIMSFDWFDYPGGLLDRKNAGDMEEYEKVKEAIHNSSSLFICVDGSLLLGDDRDDKVDNIRDNCSYVINSFISDYFKTKDSIPPTSIIVTKYDICKDDTNEDDLCEIIQESFSPFFIDNEVEKIVSIIPVSLGSDIMDGDCSGKMKPINMHLPIFMGIWFAMIKRIHELDEARKSKLDASNKKIDFLKQEKTKEESRWFSSDEKIKEMAKQIQEAENSKNEQDSKTKDLLNTMANNLDSLIKELKKIELIYINGRKTSFSELIK